MTYGPASWPVFRLNETKTHGHVENYGQCNDWNYLHWSNNQITGIPGKIRRNKCQCAEHIAIKNVVMRWSQYGHLKKKMNQEYLKQPLQWDKEMGFVNWTWKRVRVGMTERDIHLKAVWLKLFLAVMAQTVESLFSFSAVKYRQLSFAYTCMKHISLRCKCFSCAKYFTHADVANCGVTFIQLQTLLAAYLQVLWIPQGQYIWSLLKSGVTSLQSWCEFTSIW